MKQSQSQSADTREISRSDEAIIPSAEREPTPSAEGGSDLAANLATAPTTQPIEPQFDIGSGDEETADGLDAEAEAVRQAAEEGALDEADDADIPVFDRANRSERM